VTNGEPNKQGESNGQDCRQGVYEEQVRDGQVLVVADLASYPRSLSHAVFQVHSMEAGIPEVVALTL
jgi:hypothetical protein